MPKTKVLISNLQRQLDGALAKAALYNTQGLHQQADIYSERAEGIWQSIQIVKEWRREV